MHWNSSNGYILLEGGGAFQGEMAAVDLPAMELAGGNDCRIELIPAAVAPDNNHFHAGQIAPPPVMQRLLRPCAMQIPFFYWVGFPPISLQLWLRASAGNTRSLAKAAHQSSS